MFTSKTLAANSQSTHEVVYNTENVITKLKTAEVDCFTHGIQMKVILFVRENYLKPILVHFPVGSVWARLGLHSVPLAWLAS